MGQFIREKNQYSYYENGERLAEITFKFIDENVIDVNHTFVNPILRGQGMAKQLVNVVVNEAREKGWKIKPSCSYVSKVFEQDETYRDINYL